MKERLTLYADEGMILTDGEVYGKIIHLAQDMAKDHFYEITEEEYAERIKEEKEV